MSDFEDDPVNIGGPDVKKKELHFTDTKNFVKNGVLYQN